MPATPQPKLIATDLDGTIISYAHTRTGYITPRTVEAFHAAHAAGIEIVYVTGRPMRWMSGLMQSITLDGPAICSNGAVLYDMAQDRVIQAHPLPHQVVAQARDRIKQAMPTASFAAETLDGFNFETEFMAGPDGVEVSQTRARDPENTGRASHMRETTSVTQHLTGADNVLKFMVRVPEAQPDALLAQARHLLEDTVAVTHSAPGMPLIEISRTDVNKATTLAEYAHSLGIEPESVVAFGDMLNDAEMLGWAGRGYAMASGHPELLKVADEVIPGVEDDGVAQIIESFLA